jgi:hypothetical protein
LRQIFWRLKKRTFMAQGILGYPAIVSEWEMAMRGGQGKIESLIQSHREV